MLVQFRVSNFLSFKDEVTFSMVSANIKEHFDSNVFQARKDLRLLKSAVIYGANASGKSNLFNAMKFMRSFTLNSSKNMQSGEKISVEKFKFSTETENNPSLFEMIFVKDNIRYRYGFEVNQVAVMSEWLYRVVASKKTEELLFYREEDRFEIGKFYKEGIGLEQKTRKNALFLSVVAQFNGHISEEVLDWFSGLYIISGLSQRHEMLSDLILENEKIKSTILKYMQEADFSIEDITIERNSINFDDVPPNMRGLVESLRELAGDSEIPSSVTKIKMFHKKYDQDKKVISLEPLDMQKWESKGTRKFFSLLSPVLFALGTGKTFIVDELDSSLHPLLTKYIVRLFHSKVHNEYNSQLIFNTHDTNLLSRKLFRRDQIWFTEKDRYGASEIYSLIEYRVRNDASYEKDYLEGRYGSIPFIGNLDFDCGLEERETVGNG